MRVAAFFMAAFLLAVLAIPSAAEPKPNFIIILCDDLGYGDIGPFGAKRIATPNLERMAAEGIKLTSFYASANVCTPSRAGLLTGRYAIRMGLAYKTLESESNKGLPESEITLAESLKALGYKTACIGKWHLGSFPKYHPYRHGFDYFYGLPFSNDMYPLSLYRGEESIESPVTVASMATLTERYTAESIKFIEQNKDHPFFLYLAHTMPHMPLAVSEKFKKHSKSGLYGDVVEELDSSTEEILATVKRLGLDENTMIVFTSDNGPWYEGSSGPYRGRKGDAWEGGLRVPFIARWPGKIASGVASNVPASNLDFFPTLTRLAGGTIPTGDAAHKLDGLDMTSLLHIKTAADTIPAAFADRAIYMFDNERIGAVRVGRWKLALRGNYRTKNYSLEEGFYRPGMLIDLENDPEESYNAARDNPEDYKRLVELVAAAKVDFKVPVDKPPVSKRKVAIKYGAPLAGLIVLLAAIAWMRRKTSTKLPSVAD